MSKRPGVIPVSDARDIGKKRKCPLVVIFAIEEDVTRFTVTTWGRDKALCKVAASFGDQFREAVFNGDVEPPVSPSDLPDKPTITHGYTTRTRMCRQGPV
jgi:hypothetical protein